MKPLRSTLTAIAFAALATACGAGAEVADAPDPSGSAAGTEATADGIIRCSSFDADCEEQLAPDTVEIRGIMFRPGTIEVAVGTIVSFDNLDPVGHTVTAGTPDAPGSAFDDVVDAEASTTVTFDEAGEIVYFCRVHPSMTGTVVVS